MAKYCSKCGRVLPEGKEKCPVCHPEEEGSDAALFTRMTAETEVWKEAPKPGGGRKIAKRIRSSREKLALYSGAVLLVAITAFIIIFTQPASVVKRAVKSEDYDKAFTVYSEKLLGKSEAADSSIGKLLYEKAQLLCTEFEQGEISEAEAENTFSKLYAFGLNTAGLDTEYKQFDKLKGTQSKLDKAEGLLNVGSYLEACDIFLSIPEGDTEYENAQKRAKDSLDMYAAGIQAEASMLMEDSSYPEALNSLRQADAKLAEYGSFSAGIDAKFDECCEKYEAYALLEAKNLADIGQYSGAADLLRSCMDAIGSDTEELLSAYDAYMALSDEKTAQESIERAEEYYKNGAYADAFTELDTALERSENGERLTAALSDMEQRFTDDMVTRARETFDSKRENISAALEVIDAARAIRPLAGLDEYEAVLESYEPYDLVGAEYSVRDGDIYRINESFDGLDGSKYTGGWIWGGEGAYICFALGGQYDSFTGTLAARRDDGVKAEGWFEIFCDGESRYKSETLAHGKETIAIDVDISGCDELKIVFHSNYETSTANDGYCYHGICAPQLLRNII